jgi:membrane associated rhomboid family serine protease
MGLYDRDYYRENPGGFFDSLGRQGKTVWWLIVITCFTFLVQIVTKDMKPGGVDELARYDYRLVMQGEVWRLFTPIFLSDSLLRLALLHLVLNMLVLYWAGSQLEDYLGSREFLLFYLLAGTAAGIICFLTQLAGIFPHGQLIDDGVLCNSAPITAVLVFFAFRNPHQQILVMFVLPVPIWFAVVGYIALDTLGSGGVIPGLRLVMHLVGGAIGLIYFKTGVRLLSWTPSLPARHRAPKLRIVPRPDRERPVDEDEEEEEVVGAAVEMPSRGAENSDENFEARVDRVLEKVSKFGQESLTSEERELLFRASDVYKKRRK